MIDVRSASIPAIMFPDNCRPIARSSHSKETCWLTEYDVGWSAENPFRWSRLREVVPVNSLFRFFGESLERKQIGALTWVSIDFVKKTGSNRLGK